MNESKIKNGFSENQKWVFTIVFSLLILLVGYRIIFAEYSIDLTNFSFSEFLSLILAIFAVSLSAAFYFKATDSSSKFYDNTYKFTKDIAELLVKIESGFGEKLRHLDEGYNNMLGKIDRIPFDLTGAKVKEEEEKREVADIKAKEQKIIADLMGKAKLAEGEKTEILSQLEQTKEELSEKERDLRFLQNEIASKGISLDDEINLINFMMDFVIKSFPLKKGLSDNEIIYYFRDIQTHEGINTTLFLEMVQRGLVDGERLTKLGVRIIRECIVMKI